MYLIYNKRVICEYLVSRLFFVFPLLTLISWCVYSTKGGAPPKDWCSGLASDPDILAALQDPEVEEAFKDICGNPANMSKYQTNPKVMTLMAKMMGKMGGGCPSGFGFPGFGAGGRPASGPDGGAAGAPPPPPASAAPDVD